MKLFELIASWWSRQWEDYDRRFLPSPEEVLTGTDDPTVRSDWAQMAINLQKEKRDEP
jgi:hypothetical protein